MNERGNIWCEGIRSKTEEKHSKICVEKHVTLIYLSLTYLLRLFPVGEC
jgi:hypothetical protein